MSNVLPHSPAPADPLAQLHKMSATAGAAIAQYVAINTLAIVALLLGILSILSILVSALLVVPAAGIILGLLSLAQINRSNGTQTGRIPAYLGLLLCLAMSGIAAAGMVVARMHFKARTHEVLVTLDQLSAAVGADDYAAAYQSFAPEFQARIKYPYFAAQWKNMQQKDWYGKIHALRWNQVGPHFSDDTRGQVPSADLKARIEADQPNDSRIEIRFRERGGVWKIYDMPDFFLAEQHF